MKKNILLIFTMLIINMLTFGYNEQVIVSQFDVGLENSTSTSSNYTYSLSGVTQDGNIRAIDSTSLDDTIDFSDSIVYGSEFSGSGSTLTYASSGEKSIIIPVERNTNTSDIVTGSFQLTQTSTASGEKVVNYLIQDNYILPAKSINLSKNSSASTGVEFTYDESSVRSLHLKSYKIQKYLIRVAKSSVSDTNYDILNKLNGRQLANDTDSLTNTTYMQSFLEGNRGYADFWVTADQFDEQQSIETSSGVSLKFLPGTIDIFGLPNGSYRVEVYSFRYSKEISNKGNVVITKEDSENFSIGSEYQSEGIDIISFSSADFATIKATLLTVSSTPLSITNSGISVREEMGSTSTSVTPTINNETLTSIYLNDSTTPVPLGTNGAYTSSGTTLYYQKWSITYLTPYTTIDTNKRTAYFKLGSSEVNSSYTVEIATDDFSSSPLYQTVFVGLNNTNFSIGTFEIDDKNMNKYSHGYRSVRTASVPLTSSAIDMSTIYKGNTTSSPMGLNSSYNWEGSSSGNSLIISKAISDSKGIFQNTSSTSENFTFYTTTWTPALSYTEATASSVTDTANFSWSSPDKTSFNTTVSEDKVIFRVVKSSSPTPEYLYSPSEGLNSITESSSENLTAFLGGTKDYFDLVFTSGTDSQLTIDDAIFTFSKSNTLQIIGLDAGTYQLQIYSLQNEDTTAQGESGYDYRVLTYGATTNFKMGLPVLETGTFTSQNNIFLIDSLNVTSTLDTSNNPIKNVQVGLVIKAEEEIKDLTTSNLIAQKDEVSTTNSALNLYTDNKVTEMWNNNSSIASDGSYNYIKSATNIKLTKSSKADFQYPLDIVFLIDNSGSMQNEIDSVKDSLENFSSLLTAKGYDVKFNLITFGPQQTTSTIGNASVSAKYNNNYLAVFKDTWYSSVSDLVTDFGKLSASGGYTDGQEDGAWALHYGIEKLKSNGRYLNKSFAIVDSSASSDEKYLPSKKWIILLTDENMDTNSLPTASSGTAYTSSNVVSNLASRLSSAGINLTGIYHTDVKVTDATTEALYKNAISSTSETASESSYSTQNSYYANVNSSTYAISNSNGGYYFTMNGTTYTIYKDSSGNAANSIANGTYYYRTGSTTTNSYIAVTSNGNQNSQGNNPTKVNVNGENYSISNDSTGYKYFTMNNTTYYLYSLSGTTYSKITTVSPGTTYYYYGATTSYSYTSFPVTSTSGTTWSGYKWLNFSDELGHDGIHPADYDETFYTEFALQGLGSLFSMYEMGDTGQYVSSALADSISNIGIIQRWNLTYTSPFSKNDGLKRESIFSLKGLTKYVTSTSTSALTVNSAVIDGTRIYTVPEQKIDAYFIKPSESTKQLEKSDGSIILKAKAISQYKKTIDGVSTTVNYPITKGTFIITGNYSNDGVTVGTSVTKTVTSDDKTSERVYITKTTEDGSIWYYETSTLDANSFTKSFGTNPTNVVVKFIAETSEESKTITLDGVTVVDKDPPKIVSLVMTNTTLSNFMSNLKASDNTLLFSTDKITNATTSTRKNTDAGLTNSIFTNVTNSDGSITNAASLNVKNGDIVTFKFVLSDESIDSSSKTVKVIYNGITYIATYLGKDTSDSTDSYRTIWSVNVPYTSGNTSISFDIQDACSNQSELTGGTAFLEPNTLGITTFVGHTDNLAGLNYSNYYNSGNLISTKITEDALAYMTVFNYDSTASDKDSSYTHVYPTNSDGVDYIASSDGTFTFGEGKHSYANIYIVNKAGAISSITYDGTLDNAVNILNTIQKSNDFYIDTVAPRLSDLVFKKSSDTSLSNSETLNNNSVASSFLLGAISSSRKYKGGDTIGIDSTISEYNYLKTDFSQYNSLNIMTSETITANNSTLSTLSDGSEGSNIHATEMSYKKYGIAIDLTESSESEVSPSITVTVLDKAGNSSTGNIVAYYSDITPSTLSVAYKVDNNSTPLLKFTNNSSLPLNDISDSRNAVGLLESGNSNYIGNIYNSASKNLVNFKTNSGSNYAPIDNLYNSFALRSYSYSGKMGSVNTDSIILDTAINDSRSTITETDYTTLSSGYSVNLTDTLSTIKELVGLASFNISTDSNSSIYLKSGTTSTLVSSLGITKSLVSDYNTVPTATSYNTEYNLIIPTSGIITFDLELTDRLGNNKTITYIVSIPKGVSIIGKTSSSDKQIESKAILSDKIKILSREE